MGGHAFPHLHCPRIPRELYLKTREQTTDALRKLFRYVIVPTEMPGKKDYGDVDFLVSGFLHASPTTTSLDWPAMELAVKQALCTTKVHRGFLNTDVIFTAIWDQENDFWIQVDIKVCLMSDKRSIDWGRFQLNYASGSKMIGSLLKPLGFTLNPEGLHIRVEEMEDTNFAGSMVFVTKDPLAVLRIVGLDRRILHSGFSNNEEIYDYFSSSWVFRPAHFAERLEDEKYIEHLKDRSAPWVDFVTRWIPQRYPRYRFSHQELPLEEWYKQTRVAIREKVLTQFPSIATTYYAKYGIWLREQEEQRLRDVLMRAIPTGVDGWNDDIRHRPIIIRAAAPTTPPLEPTDSSNMSDSASPTFNTHSSSTPGEVPPTPPPTPPSSVHSFPDSSPMLPENPLDTPLYLPALPRDPPMPFQPRPPPQSMCLEAKLLCIARWTHFDAGTGNPYLAREPRDKKFEMCWSNSGLRDEALVAWVRDMWWAIWVRQSWINYVGMWKHRFEKEDAKKAKAKEMEAVRVKEEIEAQRKTAEIKAKREKIMSRLRFLNGIPAVVM